MYDVLRVFVGLLIGLIGLVVMTLGVVGCIGISAVLVAVFILPVLAFIVGVGVGAERPAETHEFCHPPVAYRYERVNA